MAAGCFAACHKMMAVAWVLLDTVKRSSAQLQADLRVSSKMVLTFVTNHLPISTGDKLVKVPLQTFQYVASK